MTRLLFEEQPTPRHEAAQASPPLQLDSSSPWASLCRRKSVSASVSFGTDRERVRKAKATAKAKGNRYGLFIFGVLGRVGGKSG